MQFKTFFALFISSGFLVACDPTETEPTQPYDSGVIVLNSGNFFDNNGSLSLISRTGQSANYDIFQKENLRSLAGGLSGYAEVFNKGIILVDNSTAGKDLIEIVNARTFKSEASIPSTEIENPRSVIEVSETKAYVTAWDATGDFSNFYVKPGYIAVLDLNTNKIIKRIAVQNGAETLFKVGNEVYVGNTGSGKSVLSVIDIATDALKQTIEVGKNPQIIGLDANSKLWVYAAGELKTINTGSKMIESTLKINSSNSSKSPSSFVFSSDKKTIYYTFSFYDPADNYKQKGETYSFNISTKEIETKTPFINRLFGGGLGVDPQTGNLYAGLVPSLKQSGYVFRYKSDGVLIDSVKAEISPSKFFFKK